MLTRIFKCECLITGSLSKHATRSTPYRYKPTGKHDKMIRLSTATAKTKHSIISCTYNRTILRRISFFIPQSPPTLFISHASFHLRPPRFHAFSSYFSPHLCRFPLKIEFNWRGRMVRKIHHMGGKRTRVICSYFHTCRSYGASKREKRNASSKDTSIYVCMYTCMHIPK